MNFKIVLTAALLNYAMESSGQIIEDSYFKSTDNLSISNRAGAFMQFLAEADNSWSRAAFSYNAYWNRSTNLWQVGNVGANDVSTIFIPNSGGFDFIIHPSSGNVSKTLTHSSFLAGSKMKITVDGNVGIGTDPSPFHAGNRQLVVGSGTGSNGITIYSQSTNDGKIAFTDVNSSYQEALISYHHSDDYMRFKVNGTDVMRIDNTGNVGIGTTTPDAKLTVKGDIHTQEVNVDLLGAVAPDYVFEEDYDLKSLEETEQYIQANKHLPEIPSAAEMEEHGLDLKEMNLKLLQKVEELTLHLIEQDKKIKELQEIVKPQDLDE